MKEIFTPLKSLLTLFFLLITLSVQATDYFWIGGSGDVNDLSHWATASGGATTHGFLPGTNDNLIFDANSFTANGQQVNFNQNLGFHDLTADNLGFSIEFIGSGDWNVYGSVYVSNEVTLKLSSSFSFNFSDNESVFIAQNNFNLDNPQGVNMDFSGSGILTLNSGLAANALYHNSGEVIYGANTFDFKFFFANFSSDRIIDITDATLNVGRWTLNENANITLISTNSTINVNDEFYGASKQYNNLVISMPELFNDVVIEGDNTFSYVVVNEGIEVEFESGSVQTITSSLAANGTSSDLIEFISSTEGIAASITGSGITISGEYLNIKDVNFVGTATFSLENSLVLDDSEGWEINSVPTPTGTGSFFFSKIYSDSVYLGLTAGGGQERIVFMREGTFPDVTVADNIAYTANATFGQGDLVGTDTYVVYQGNENLVKIDGLQPNTEYYMARMEVNSTPDNSSIKYQSTSAGFSKYTSTLNTGNIYMQNGSVSVNNGDSFYDDGGKGFFFPNRSQVLTLNSAVAGKSVKLTFNELDLRSNEKLRIFDGADTTATLLQSLSGASHTLPLSVSALGESLTVKFESGDFETSEFSSKGWQADVEILLPKPTIRSKNAEITAFTDISIDFSFTPGSGVKRLIVVRPVNYQASYSIDDNTSYTANSEFGMGQHLGNSSYVVGNGDLSSLSVTGLPNVSAYNVRIWEYNEIDGEIVYADSFYSFEIRNDLEPPIEASGSYEFRFRGYTKVTQTTIENNTYFYYPNGNYSNDRKRLTLASTHPIDTVALKESLIDDLTITADVYGQGDELMEGVYAVEKVKFDPTTTLEGFSPETTYYFAYIFLNENAAGVRYGLDKITTATFETLSTAELVMQEGTATISQQMKLYDPLVLSYRSGKESGFIQTFYPENPGEKLAFIADYINLNNRPLKFEFRIYDGEDLTAPLLADYSGKIKGSLEILSELKATNEKGALTFHYQINSGSFNSSQGPFGFYGTLFIQNQLTAPSVKVSQVTVNDITKESANVSWKRGNGDNVLIVLNKSESESKSPVNGIRYDEGQQLLIGQKIAYIGTSENLLLSNLTPDANYQIDFYEMFDDGVGVVYGEKYSTSFNTISNRPTIAASDFKYEVINDTQIKLKWKNGDGEKRMVIAKDNGYFTPIKLDFDGVSLPEGNSNYENGETYFSSDNYYYKVLYLGSADSVIISGISQNNEYYYSVIELNGEDNLTNFLYNKYERFALYPSVPTAQVSNAKAKDPTATTVKLNWDSPNYLYQIVYISTAMEDELALDQFAMNEAEILKYKQENGRIVYSKIGSYPDGLDYILVENLQPNTTYYATVYYANRRADSYSLNKIDPAKVSFTTGDYKEFYWVGGYGNWFDKNHWATSSGGAILHDTIPNNESIVIVDENSFSNEDLAQIDAWGNLNMYAAEISFNARPILINNYDSASQYSRYQYWNVSSNLIFSDSVTAGPRIVNFYFKGGLDENTIYIPEQLNANGLDYVNFNGVEPTHQYNILSMPSIINNLDFTNIKVDLGFTDELTVKYRYREFENVVLSSIPEKVNIGLVFRSFSRFSKVAKTNSYDKLEIFQSPTIDSLFINGKDLQVYPEANLTVNHIINEHGNAWKIYSGTKGKEGYISTERDSLIVQNVEIYDNHALGAKHFIARDAITYGNVVGWVLDSFKSPSAPLAPKNVYLFYGDSTKIDVKWELTEFGEPILMIWEDVKGNEKPINNTAYKFGNQLDLIDSVGTARVINLKDYSTVQLQGLKPNSQYYLELYSYNQFDTLITYSNNSAKFNFQTSKGGDVFFGNSYDDVIIANGQTLYSAQGIGYSHSANDQYQLQYLSILPNDVSRKVVLKLEFSENHVMKMQLNSSESNELLADFYLSAFGDPESYDSTYISPTHGEGFKARLQKRGWSSAYPSGPRFNIQSVYGQLSTEPLAVVEDFQVAEVSDSSITLNWNSQPDEKVLIVAKKGNSIGFVPEDYFQYSGNDSFGLAEKEFNSGEFIVFSGSGNQTTVKNLDQNSNYSFKAFSFAQLPDADPNYKTDTAAFIQQKTLISLPNTELDHFEILDVKSNSIAFNLSGYNADGAIVVASREKDFVFEPSDSLALDLFNNFKGFNNAPEIVEGVRLLYAGDNQIVDYDANNYLENTSYYLKVFAFNGSRDDKRFQKSFLKYDSIKTIDASYEITSLSDELVCPSSTLNLSYKYLGLNYNNQLAKVIISIHEDMQSPIYLEILDSADFNMELLIPENLAVGDYHIAVVPESGNFEIISRPIAIDKSSSPEIYRQEDYLLSNVAGNTLWYRNNELMSNVENTDSLLLTQEGLYYQLRSFANCEYASNQIYVKSRVSLNQDTTQSCSGQSVVLEFENTFGSLSESFNYYTLVLDNSGNELNLEIDEINLNENYFNFSLPDNLPSNYYSLILKVEGDSIVSDTAIFYIENMEPVVITLTESGLSSNYAEGNQWLFNGEPIIGANAQTISIDRSGVYSVEVSAGNCTLVSEGITLTSNVKGLLAVGFSAYPNPVRNDLSLKYTGDEYLGLSGVVITDLTGKVIYNSLHNFQSEDKLDIPMNEISSGVYIITIETQNYRAQQKLIKK